MGTGERKTGSGVRLDVERGGAKRILGMTGVAVTVAKQADQELPQMRVAMAAAAVGRSFLESQQANGVSADIEAGSQSWVTAVAADFLMGRREGEARFVVSLRRQGAVLERVALVARQTTAVTEGAVCECSLVRIAVTRFAIIGRAARIRLRERGRIPFRSPEPGVTLLTVHLIVRRTERESGQCMQLRIEGDLRTLESRMF